MQCEICEIVQLSKNKTKVTSIMASPGDNRGFIYIHIHTPGDKMVNVVVVVVIY